MRDTGDLSDAAILDGGQPFDDEELAAFLRVAKRTPERWRVKGTGPVYILVGGRVRYLRPDVAAWLAARRRRSTSDPVEGER